MGDDGDMDLHPSVGSQEDRRVRQGDGHGSNKEVRRNQGVERPDAGQNLEGHAGRLK